MVNPRRQCVWFDPHCPVSVVNPRLEMKTMGAEMENLKTMEMETENLKTLEMETKSNGDEEWWCRRGRQGRLVCLSFSLSDLIFRFVPPEVS